MDEPAHCVKTSGGGVDDQLSRGTPLDAESHRGVGRQAEWMNSHDVQP